MHTCVKRKYVAGETLYFLLPYSQNLKIMLKFILRGQKEGYDMKILRGMAYALILLCVIGSIGILTYSGNGKSATDEADSVTSDSVTVNAKEVSAQDVISAAGTIISDVADDVKDAVSNLSGTSGEVSYDEIVRLQEEEALAEQKAVVEASNKANGISANDTISSSTVSITSTEGTDYAYVVSKSSGKIHKLGCLIEPSGVNALYYNTLEAAIVDGYTLKCTVCSP